MTGRALRQAIREAEATLESQLQLKQAQAAKVM